MTTPGELAGTRLVKVQFGNYAQAAARRARGEPETYYAQNYTLDHEDSLVARGAFVADVCVAEDQAEVRHRSGVVTAGLELYPRGRRARHGALIECVAAFSPTHLLVESPIVPLLQWGLRRRLQMLPLFMDSFRADSVRARVRFWRLARALNHPHIRWVANHGRAAAEDLARIGVDRAKILPFDWPALLEVLPPRSFTASQAANAPFRLVYVGALIESKGVGDAIRAIALLRTESRAFTLTVIGTGDEPAFRARAMALGVADRVVFRGRVAHDDIAPTMRDHDAVLVPTRHDYPEAKPMTIYEAFCSGTPLIASDHPMFAARIDAGRNALVFAAGDPRALADCVRALAGDADLAAQLAARAAVTAANYFEPLKWRELLEGWLRGRAADDASLAAHALAPAHTHALA